MNQIHKLQAKKDLLSYPGDTIQEIIDDINMTQAELAERLGRSKEKLNELIKGKAPLTKETALKLEYVLGIPASFWNNLEREYRDELFKIEQMEYLIKCEDWLSKFPLNFLKKCGILPSDSEAKGEMVQALLKFFRVASPDEWSNIYKNNSLAFKIELRHTTHPEAISVWLRLGEIEAEKLSLAPFKGVKEVRNNLDKIKKLCYEEPIDWLIQLRDICAELGIALVYMSLIEKAPIYGATRWIQGNANPLIQITDRNKDYNSFWFTFYHELAHVLLHGKKDIFLEGISEINPDLEKEKEADDFAARTLIPDKVRNKLSGMSHFDEKVIISLSREYNSHQSILVSQLQREDKMKYFELNHLKTRVEFGDKELNLC